MAEVLLTDGVITVDGVEIENRLDLVQFNDETGQPVIDPATGDYTPKYDIATVHQINELLMAQVPTEIKNKMKEYAVKAGNEVFKKILEALSILKGTEEYDGLVPMFTDLLAPYGGDVLMESMRQDRSDRTKFANHIKLTKSDIAEMYVNAAYAKMMLEILLNPDNPQSALNVDKKRAITRAIS